MLFFYDLGIRVYGFILLLVSPFNAKAQLLRQGRKGLLRKIAGEVDASEKSLWFHFPSLGEFEQGRPVLEALKGKHPGKKVIVTFFSPSGYTVRKNYAEADHVFYLPADTAANAREFIRLINPGLVVFTKYDYWYHYFYELRKNEIPLYVISAIFSERQPFFKFYGSLHRQLLQFITRIFVQDEHSRQLLASLGVHDVTVSGDTRFDRVITNAGQVSVDPLMTRFIGEHPVFIAGSTWPKDEELIKELVSLYPDWKFIIAPHEVGTARIHGLSSLFSQSSVLKISEMRNNSEEVNETVLNPASQILLIDNIGMLSSLYQYGDIAYIGGGFGAGIHNTLEAAAFDLPVIFGPNYKRFKEANDLVNENAAFCVRDAQDLQFILYKLADKTLREEAGSRAGSYVMSHGGATAVIVKEITEGREISPTPAGGL